MLGNGRIPEVDLLRQLLAAKRSTLASDCSGCYWSGMLLSAQGGLEAALGWFERGLALNSSDSGCLAASADLMLQMGRIEAAGDRYERAYGALLRELEDPLPGLTSTAHWIWHKGLARVQRFDISLEGDASNLDLVAAARTAALVHMQNYASWLATQGRLAEACRLFHHVVERDRESSYAHCALGYLYTLCGQWESARRHCLETLRLGGGNLLGDLTELCLLQSTLELGGVPGSPYQYAEWVMPDAGGSAGSQISRLPHLEGDLIAPESGPCFFIACDSAYLREHAVYLVASVARCMERAHVHIHLFNEGQDDAPVLGWLRTQLGNISLSITHEEFHADDMGPIGRYAPHARFVRLAQWLKRNKRPVVMIDADSLILRNPFESIDAETELAMVFADSEPLWHRVLGGFVYLSGSVRSIEYISMVADCVAATLATGVHRFYLDQTVLATLNIVLAREGAAPLVQKLNYRFCDTVFHEGSFVWSITADKSRECEYTRLRAVIGGEYGIPGFPVLPGEGQTATGSVFIGEENR